MGARAPRFSLAIAHRIVAAVLGGYAFAVALSILLSYRMAPPRFEAAMTGVLLSFFFYLLAIVWVFAVRSVRLMWAGMLGVTLVVALAAWCVRPDI